MTNRLIQLLRTQQHKPMPKFARKIHSAAATKRGWSNRRVVEDVAEKQAVNSFGKPITKQKELHFTKGYQWRTAA